MSIIETVILLNNEAVIPSAIVNSVVIVIVLCVLFILGGRMVQKADPRLPSKGIVLIFELVVEGIDKLCQSMLGDKKGRYGPFIGSLIAYLLVANLLGLFGFTAPTTNYNVTLSLALFAIAYMHLSGVRAKGMGRYLKDTFLGDYPLLLPLNAIGEVAKILSLSFRLFGNILSGSVISFVIMYLMGWFAIIMMPVLNIYFDIFAGLIQTLIFCFLFIIWFGGAVVTEE